MVCGKWEKWLTTLKWIIILFQRISCTINKSLKSNRWYSNCNFCFIFDPQILDCTLKLLNNISLLYCNTGNQEEVYQKCLLLLVSYVFGEQWQASEANYLVITKYFFSNLNSKLNFLAVKHIIWYVLFSWNLELSQQHFTKRTVTVKRRKMKTIF